MKNQRENRQSRNEKGETEKTTIEILFRARNREIKEMGQSLGIILWEGCCNYRIPQRKGRKWKNKK